VFTRYPFQGALFGLPPEVIKECILGAVEARFGPLHEQKEVPPTALAHATTGNGKTKANGNGNGHAKHNGHAKAELEDCCADGTVESVAGNGTAACAPGDSSGEPRNFEEFIYKVWGAGIAKHFAIPYNKKLWAVPLSEMETSWLGGRVPLPDLEEMIDGALKPVPKPMGPNARFGYPLRGGFQALMDGFLPHLEGELRLNTAVTAVSAKRRTVTLDTGETVPFEVLVSTMPLPVLVQMLGDEAPAAVREAAAGLRYVSVRCVNLGIGREALTEKHWIYYPEDTIFHRIFVQGNASPHCNPPGGFGLTCEITYSEYKPLPVDGEALIQRCIDDCRRVGFFTAEDPIWAANQVDMPHAYVVYDHARAETVGVIRDWLRQNNILLAGRYSEWEYYNSDHAFLAGRKAAEAAQALRRAPEEAAAYVGRGL
jgi:UDP-galactopyranose mutase